MSTFRLLFRSLESQVRNRTYSGSYEIADLSLGSDIGLVQAIRHALDFSGRPSAVSTGQRIWFDKTSS